MRARAHSSVRRGSYSVENSGVEGFRVLGFRVLGFGCRILGLGFSKGNAFTWTLKVGKAMVGWTVLSDLMPF